MSYARGKFAFFISDRSGMRFPYRERIKEWNGSIVHKSEYEEKHPQLDPHRSVVDAEALRDARPDTKVVSAVENLLGINSFISSSGSAVITVIEPNHGRATNDTVRFRKVLGFDGFSSNILTQASGYVITKVDDNSYTFTASSGTATTGSVKGGGSNSTAGPVTLGA
jgi:hypothetical protein|tara:strand:- start:150 stop:650 length:501 start_codon:yes stop_codon:yes gene_type:complete